MPRRNDIESAFRSAMHTAPGGKRTVTTADFVQELGRINWCCSLRTANHWIEMSVSVFSDITPDASENRTFVLSDRNGGH
ncbi:DNA polymerase V [Atlantibacter sp.]|uniref:DNA polymerase V n=1 Tax=Atlantibacter sp. TaxID=1903473 RepID=UPI0028AAE2F9|nr:DNA polymerase V [Atlantibacter sp.]